MPRRSEPVLPWRRLSSRLSRESSRLFPGRVSLKVARCVLGQFPGWRLFAHLDWLVSDNAVSQEPSGSAGRIG